MKYDGRLDRLFAMAREADLYTARLEAGFETRLMVRIRARSTPMSWGAWSWRLAPVFIAVVLAMGALYYVTPQQATLGDLRAAITVEYDNTMPQYFLSGE